MDAAALKDALRQRARLVENRLVTLFADGAVPGRLREAMEYSLCAGGKRLRPALVLAWAELEGLAASDVLDFACALECIHTYSLIHDDLPAMDNDDLRRGKPSCHKQFDEATAILAGDGLLTEAFLVMARTPLEASRVLAAVAAVADAAGPRGMVGGQMLDMELTGGRADLPALQAMHRKKTGALIAAACVAGALLAGGDTERAQCYGHHLGLAFQITDDILDVVGDTATLGKPVGSDERQGKSTYPALVGMEQSRALAQQSIDQAVAALAPYGDHPQALFLRRLAQYLMERSQ
jgi:geranylgeranyl diphosphate synthase type II